MVGATATAEEATAGGEIATTKTSAPLGQEATGITGAEKVTVTEAAVTGGNLLATAPEATSGATQTTAAMAAVAVATAAAGATTRLETEAARAEGASTPAVTQPTEAPVPAPPKLHRRSAEAQRAAAAAAAAVAAGAIGATRAAAASRTIRICNRLAPSIP